jgi:hypothetical protein
LATQRREENNMTETGSAAPSKRAPRATPPSASATGAVDNAAGGDGSAGGQASATASKSPTQEREREWAWGAIVVIAGLLSIVAVFIFAVFQYTTAAEVTTAVGAVSGVIAALVGAYFGIRGASLAQINSESGGSTPPKTKT